MKLGRGKVRKAIKMLASDCAELVAVVCEWNPFVVLAVAVIIVLSGVESAVAERESERRTWTLIIIFF